ncbi:MAG: hypothetical protein DCE92_01975 [Alphaproteobacteria bacterium]|nr:MAG: hypothetical protein DCE92_01975 [Alphaproteobacteria bacterium]
MTDVNVEKLGRMRIVDFIQGWRTLSMHARPSELDRVRSLIDGAGPIIRGFDKPGAAPAVISLQRLNGLFEGLKPPLESARSGGSFIDVWSVTGVRRKELPNAAVLAWLIDPRGSHGQRSLCLSALVDLIDQKTGLSLSASTLDNARVQPEERPLGSDRDRVDIVIETPELLIFVEVKIDASEGQAQLSRYVESASRVAAARPLSADGFAKRTLTVFLSSRAPTENVPEVVHITWRELSKALTTASRAAPEFAGMLIHSFAVHSRSFG